MDSRLFIKRAASLTTQIKEVHALTAPEVRTQVQKDINQLFQGLHNPTLPSASKLRDTATNAGFAVDQKVLVRLQQAEAAWE